MQESEVSDGLDALPHAPGVATHLEVAMDSLGMCMIWPGTVLPLLFIGPPCHML